MAVITLLTDFGETYLAEVKGEILRVNPQVQIVDLSSRVRNLKEGAFLLRSVVRHYPYDAVHLAAIDPGGSGGKRALAVVVNRGTGTTYLLGPDNGLLHPAARSLGDFQVYQIDLEPPPDIIHAFHGRDILAPAAARLSRGEKPEALGSPISDFERLDIDTYKVETGGIWGEIIYIDPTGNLITNIPIRAVGGRLRLRDTLEVFGQKLPFLRNYGDAPRGEPLVLVGSHDTLEISVNRGSAAERFGSKEGDRVVLKITG
ncbi:MAG: SAM-dependent chlorinase/fluorinase [Euryarchaeota archaeon]|nr:SAM-dependent chlorinase/fluorinase [Euryarchaeota archaeon]